MRLSRLIYFVPVNRNSGQRSQNAPPVRNGCQTCYGTGRSIVGLDENCETCEGRGYVLQAAQPPLFYNI